MLIYHSSADVITNSSTELFLVALKDESAAEALAEATGCKVSTICPGELHAWLSACGLFTTWLSEDDSHWQHAKRTAKGFYKEEAHPIIDAIREDIHSGWPIPVKPEDPLPPGFYAAYGPASDYEDPKVYQRYLFDWVEARNAEARQYFLTTLASKKALLDPLLLTIVQFRTATDDPWYEQVKKAVEGLHYLTHYEG